MFICIVKSSYFMTQVDGSLIKEPIMTTISNQLAKAIREARKGVKKGTTYIN